MFDVSLVNGLILWGFGVGLINGLILWVIDFDPVSGRVLIWIVVSFVRNSRLKDNLIIVPIYCVFSRENIFIATRIEIVIEGLSVFNSFVLNQLHEVLSVYIKAA